jgi:flagellar basal body-associated protein FliL
MAEMEVVEGSGPAPAPKKPNPILGLGMIAAAVALGLVVGGAVLAPQMLSGNTGGSDEPKAQAKSHDAHGGGGSHGGGTAVEIDNVVVNPAGAEGLHFLMATVTFEVDDKKIEEYMRNNEHIIRDVVMTTLGDMTLEEFSEPGARDRIKETLRSAVGNIVGGTGHLVVYLPEFVVQ